MLKERKKSMYDNYVYQYDISIVWYNCGFYLHTQKGGYIV